MGTGVKHDSIKILRNFMNKLLFNFLTMRRRMIFVLAGWLRKFRAPIVKLLKPKAAYRLWKRPVNQLQPISNKYGFDRGLPIDRYYIEKFLTGNKRFIKGRCLEIGNNAYTVKFGEDQVTTSDVLDISPLNLHANIHGDLAHLDHVKSNTYDCLIITQTLGLVGDLLSGIKECKRILKPGGCLLFTGSLLGPIWNIEDSLWKFTPAGTKYNFGQVFGRKNILVKSYGNVYAAQAYLVGLATEELTKKELDYYDAHYPVVTTVRARKPLR